MGSVAKHALSCPALMRGVGESPSTSKRRTGLLAFKRSSKPCAHRRYSYIKARAGLESSTGSIIDVEGIVAEAPGLLALSSDLDWQQSVSELREQARGGLRAHREMALTRLNAFIDSCLHDRMLENLLQPSLQLLPRGGQDPNEEELGVRIRVQELRWQAALQATEELANGVDSSFDWEFEVAELRQCLANQQRVELEQKLWSSWESAQQGMDKDAESLHDEALNIHHAAGSYLTLFPDEKKPMEDEKSSMVISGTWWTLGFLVTAGLFGTMDAIAAIDESVTSAVVTAASKEAPAWVAPSVLAFPVLSYVLFTLYRNKVNPYAKLTDWVFGLVAMAILGNIVLIATVGVRLY